MKALACNEIPLFGSLRLSQNLETVGVECLTGLHSTPCAFSN
jgi:hypothetical protein